MFYIKNILLNLLPFAIAILGSYNVIFNNQDLLGRNIRISEEMHFFLMGLSSLNLIFTIYAILERRNKIAIFANFYYVATIYCYISINYISLFIALEMMMCFAFIVIYLSANSLYAAKISRLYFLIHFLGASLILVSTAFFINFFGNDSIVVLTPYISSIFSFESIYNEVIFFALLFFLGLVINIGIFPFSHWIIECYGNITSSSFLYLSSFTTKAILIIFMKIFIGSIWLKFLGLSTMLATSLMAAIEKNIRLRICYIMINSLGFVLVIISASNVLLDYNQIYLYQYILSFIVTIAISILIFDINTEIKDFTLDINIKNLFKDINIKNFFKNIIIICSIFCCWFNIISFPFSLTAILKDKLIHNLALNYHYIAEISNLLIYICLNPVLMINLLTKYFSERLTNYRSLFIMFLLCSILIISNIWAFINIGYSFHFKKLCFVILACSLSLIAFNKKKINSKNFDLILICWYFIKKISKIFDYSFTLGNFCKLFFVNSNKFLKIAKYLNFSSIFASISVIILFSLYLIYYILIYK